MLTIRPEHSVMPAPVFEFSFNNGEEQAKINNFLSVLAEKINANPTLEKVMFFHLFKDYVINDDIEFHYETKTRFLKNFIFEVRSGTVKRKPYSYVNPVQLSLYVPEFYETINEIFSGDDVPLPVVKKLNTSSIQEKYKQKFNDFWNKLSPVISKLEENPSDNVATLFFVKLLKEGGHNICIHDAGFFYSSFRKVDVLENDDITLTVSFPSNNPAYNIEAFSEHPCKDVFAWKLLNSYPESCYPYNKRQQKIIILDSEFRKELDMVLEQLNEVA